MTEHLPLAHSVFAMFGGRDYGHLQQDILLMSQGSHIHFLAIPSLFFSTAMWGVNLVSLAALAGYRSERRGDLFPQV